MKYKKGESVLMCDKLYTITKCYKNGFTGNEYDLESILPDKNNIYKTETKIPEGFLTKK